MKYNYDILTCTCDAELELRCAFGSSYVEYNFKKSGKSNWKSLSDDCRYVTCHTCGDDANISPEVIILSRLHEIQVSQEGE